MRTGLQSGTDRCYVYDSGDVRCLSETLKHHLKNMENLAIAYSGGTDSSYLVSAALDAGVDFRVYHVRSAFEKRHVTPDATKLCAMLGIDVKIIDVDILSCADVCRNDPMRCYYCKKAIFGRIIETAHQDGYNVVADGTNASDDESERPGMRALRELGVVSPLRDCGLTKSDIRELSRLRGLPTWNVPSDSCLATRIIGVPVSERLLSVTEDAENRLNSKFGLIGHRARTDGVNCTLEVTEEDWDAVSESMDAIRDTLSDLYGTVTLSDVRR